MIDVCTTCRCMLQEGVVFGFKLECKKTTCEACPLVRKGPGGPGGMDSVLSGSKPRGFTWVFK